MAALAGHCSHGLLPRFDATRNLVEQLIRFQGRLGTARAILIICFLGLRRRVHRLLRQSLERHRLAHRAVRGRRRPHIAAARARLIPVRRSSSPNIPVTARLHKTRQPILCLLNYSLHMHGVHQQLILLEDGALDLVELL